MSLRKAFWNHKCKIKRFKVIKEAQVYRAGHGVNFWMYIIALVAVITDTSKHRAAHEVLLACLSAPSVFSSLSPSFPPFHRLFIILNQSFILISVKMVRIPLMYLRPNSDFLSSHLPHFHSTLTRTGRYSVYRL